MSDERSGRGERASRAGGSETRLALLEAGAGLLREQPMGAVFSQITGRAVAKRAGRTAGAFWHHWDSQESYHRELLAYVLEPARIESTEQAMQRVRAGLAAGADPIEVLQGTSQANFESVRGDPQVPVWLAMWMKHGQDAEVAALLRENYRGVTGQVAPIIEALLEASRRRMYPPMTVETLAASFTALVQGLVLRVAVDPEAVPVGASPGDSGAGSWDLFGTLVGQLFMASTVPVD